MTLQSRSVRILLIILAGAAVLRAAVWFPLDDVLPMDGLFVDELTYSTASLVPGSVVFPRPPGMFVLAWATGASVNPVRARIIVSLLSLIPAGALYAAFRRKRGRWVRFCTAGLAISPFLILSGFQLLPAVPTAALLSLAMLAAVRKRLLVSGLLIGATCMFRAEFLIVVPMMLLLSLGRRSGLRDWSGLAAGTALAVLPVVVVNLIAGGGPVIAENGGENLWLGTSWELIGTPPGIEFEELVSVSEQDVGFQEAFLGRALGAIGTSPGRWLYMGLRKAMAFFSLPGPGRNIETGALMHSSMLLLLLPLTLLAMASGSVRCLRGDILDEAGGRLAASLVAASLVAAVVFFPSARFRTAVLPAFWFLAAYRSPSRRELLPAGLAAVVILSLSLFDPYPGMERKGLNHLLAAEHLIRTGSPELALDELDEASGSGYEGADLHNLRGVALSLTGRPLTGLEELYRAVDRAPNSPTAWENLAISLWNLGRDGEAAEAATVSERLRPVARGTPGSNT